MTTLPLVLCVDDEAEAIPAFARALEQAGCRVEHVRSPEQAIRFAKDHANEIIAVVLDMLMPPDRVTRELEADQDSTAVTLLYRDLAHVCRGAAIVVLTNADPAALNPPDDPRVSIRDKSGLTPAGLVEIVGEEVDRVASLLSPTLSEVLRSCGRSFLHWKTLSGHLVFAAFLVVGLHLSGITPLARGCVGLFLTIVYLERMINQRTMISPDWITLPLIGIGIALRAVCFADYEGALLGACGALIFGYTVGGAGLLAIRQPFLGLGTVKLLTAIGAMWGLQVWQPIAAFLGLLIPLVLVAFWRSSGRYLATSSLILCACGATLYGHVLDLPPLSRDASVYLQVETATALSWIAVAILVLFVGREIALNLAAERAS